MGARDGIGDEPADWEHVACPLCRREDALPLAERGQFGLPTHVVICPNDGLVYLSPRWTAARYARFYRSEYDRYYRPAVLTGESGPERHRNGREIWARVAELVPEGSTEVLDVGAGMGWSLEVFGRELGPQTSLSAIEASARCVENLRSTVKAKVLGSDVMGDWADAHRARFQLVAMRHVLEHFLDPIAALERVAGCLAPGGRVYIAVPNMMAPRGPLTGYWYRVPHVYYFNPDTLTECARRAGLRPVVVETSGAEVWGVFEGGASEEAGPFHSPFEQQLDRIRVQMKRDKLEAPLRLLRRIARRLR